jgi:hypothetical protein
MNDKDYNSMRQNHIDLFKNEESKNKNKSQLASILNKRIVDRQDLSKKTTAGQTEKEKPKTAIWWMIMIFCIVYGIEIVYNALIAGGPIN